MQRRHITNVHRRMSRVVWGFIVLAVSVCLVGCPDYSHLREVPDYKNMTDSGEE